MTEKIELDEMGMSAADAVFLAPNDLTPAKKTRAAVRAYLMASDQSMVSPFQIAADAIEQETNR